MLFGSQATGQVHPRSDVDIALFSYKAKLRPQIVTLAGALEDFLGREADLTIIDGETDPVLRLEVFRKVKCLYEAEPWLFFAQKCAAMRIYEDTAYLRRMRDTRLAEWLRKKEPEKVRGKIN